MRRVGGGCFLLVDVYYGPLRRHGNLQYLFILGTYTVDEVGGTTINELDVG